ncbi:MAG: twin-arginine translocase TatA/TatE family subunit [Kiritimatiellaeota bacterium]|nr:twin-arginine translocase TatA/TatE family subunit [Kiritimatiellota bacterium]
MPWNIGPTQLLLVLAIILVLFGGKKLPDLARSLGRSLGEFKKGKEEGDKVASESIKDVLDGIKNEEPKKVEEPKA